MNAKQVIGLLMVIGGIILGLYTGLWVCFIGGIVDVITEVRAENLSALGVAIGVAKVLFAGLAGWLSAIFLLIPGGALLKD